MTRLLVLRLEREHDVVAARQRARQIAELLGLSVQEQTRVSTAVSEIARNAVRYAHGGRVEYHLDQERGQLAISVCDSGPGIVELESVLNGRYRSPSGMGLGIVGAQRLMDGFDVSTSPTGTAVWLRKLLPAMPTGADAARIGAQLAEMPPPEPFGELWVQNQELVRTLADLRTRQHELDRLNQELEDTNRGVVALYAELDEKAERLRQADAMKSRFLSHMSHEFRTPLNSILALSRILLDQQDGPLEGEQIRQVEFVRAAARDLTELVNDLLDLAKVEAGKTEVRRARLDARNLLGALRGMMRPLLADSSVTLVIEDPAAPVELVTDERRVAQILRNLVSNALKYTERGFVQVALASNDTEIEFSVSDTGIGIAPEHQEHIFSEFGQLETPLHRRQKGTGLGLALSRRLAELLGGTLVVTSEVGEGSVFTLRLPRGNWALPPAGAGATAVLIIDDDPVARYTLRGLLGRSSLECLESAGAREGLERARRERPALLLLDLVMPEMSGFEALAILRGQPETREIPVVVCTSLRLTAEDRRRLEEHAAEVFPKELLGEAAAEVNLLAAARRAGWAAPDERAVE